MAGRLRTLSVRLVPAVLLCVAVTACAGIGGSASPTATPSSGAASGLDAQPAGSDYAVGPARFSFYLSDNNRALSGIRPKVYFFALQGFNALPGSQGTARYEHIGTGADTTGFYVVNTTFNRAGKWGAEVVVPPGGKSNSVQVIFDVVKRGLVPAVGTAAPRSRNPTIAQQPVTSLDSGRPPDDMHRVSIAAALAHHRPAVVLFASAAYCGIFHCVPEIAAVRSLEARYRSKVDFIHIDVFRNAKPPRLSATAAQWHISSQPWVFVVNRRGIVAAGFEGPAGADEIGAAVAHAVR